MVVDEIANCRGHSHTLAQQGDIQRKDIQQLLFEALRLKWQMANRWLTSQSWHVRLLHRKELGDEKPRVAHLQLPRWDPKHCPFK